MELLNPNPMTDQEVLELITKGKVPKSIPVGRSLISFNLSEDNSKFDITTDYSLTNS